MNETASPVTLTKERASLNRALDHAWSDLTLPGNRFAVGRSEIRGEALLTYTTAPKSLREVWEATRSHADRDYLIFGDERISYAAAHDTVDRVGQWLNGTGVRRGDRVGIAMRNYPEWLLIYWACVTRGIVAVGLNAWWTGRELAAALTDAGPRILFCDQERLNWLDGADIADVNMAVVAVRSQRSSTFSWADVTAGAPGAPEGAIASDDDACIFYTSGTTGAPKAAVLTHRNCVNNLLNMQFAAEVQAMAIGRATDAAIDLGAAAHPVGLVTTPFFHVTATNCLAHPVTAAGGKLVLMYRWNAGDAMRLIAKERVTTMGGVPTMTREVMMHPERESLDLTSLTTLVGGGAPMPPDLVATVIRDGIAARPSTGFGMTEASGIITAISGEFLANRPESCGRVMPTFEIRIVDDQGAALPSGSVGEVHVRGAGVIKEYLGDLSATAIALEHGWLRTGDIARLDDDGFLYLVDRKKDMILRGGENVSCNEVEAAIFHHIAVAEACAFSVPDDRLGEEVGAAIVLRPGASVSAADLREHLAGRLARYKIPRFIWILDQALPRTATGKVSRREVRAALQPSKAA